MTPISTSPVIESGSPTHAARSAAEPPPRRRLADRFVAAAIVVVLFAILVALAQAWAVRLEAANAARMAPSISNQRDLGVALARAAFARPDILPVYGSSELEMDIANRAPEFFRNAPDGFEVCPIGRRGASPLLLVEKAAAAREAPAAGKAVVLISQVWFPSRGETLANYAGNFSALQAMELIFGAPISPGLRRDIARRMLDYPQTLAGTPILDQGARAAAQIDTLSGRITYALLVPLGLMQTKIMELQDHFESVREVLAAPHVPAIPPTDPALNWDRLLATADTQSPIYNETNPPGLAEAWRGVSEMPTSTEWRDVDLLLRTFRELHVQTLLLDIPWSAPRYDAQGIGAGLRDAYYYSRLRSVAANFQVPIATFQDHEYDMHFLRDPHSHLSARGWVYFNRDMDAFWRGVPLPDH